MLCGQYWLEGDPTLLEMALALERVNSGPPDHARLANLMLFSVFCLNCVIGCEYIVPLT